MLLLFVPLYRLEPTAVWLLAAQAAAVGATVTPLRRCWWHDPRCGAISSLTAVFGVSGLWVPFFSHLTTRPLDAALHPWRVAIALVQPRPWA